MKHGNGGAVKGGKAPNSSKVPTTKEANAKIRECRGKSFGKVREMRKHTPHGASESGVVR